jgi:hypothetical protein
MMDGCCELEKWPLKARMTHHVEPSLTAFFRSAAWRGGLRHVHAALHT